MSNSTTVHLTFTEAVFTRPQMYTLGGSFGEVIAFLEGYYSGVAKTRPDWDPVMEWSQLEEWVAGRLGVPRTGVYRAFLERFGEDALPELKCLYAVFRQERSDTSARD